MITEAVYSDPGCLNTHIYLSSQYVTLVCCDLSRCAPTTTKGLANMAVVNLKHPVPVCTSACTSCRVTVSLEKAAKGSTASMQMLWKFWMSEDSAQKTWANSSVFTRASYSLSLPLSRKVRQVNLVILFMLFSKHTLFCSEQNSYRLQLYLFSFPPPCLIPFCFLNSSSASSERTHQTQIQ